MKKIKLNFLKIFLLTLIFLLPNISLAAINFTDGKWETTFDCFEQTQYQSAMNCDGMAWSGNWSCDGKLTTIESLANNPLGNGNGAKFWKCSGDVNLCTGTIAVVFPLPQQELWVRWYERYEAGFQWGNSIDVKSLYFKATDSNPYVGYQYGNYRFYWGGVGGGPTFPTGEAGGWDDVYPSGIADGLWHCFEVYMKMDTNGTDGIGKIWVDGILVADQSGFSWSGTDSKPHPGWEWFDFLSNQKDPALERAYFVDYDDMTIYNQTPPNVDTQGNPFIGPIGWVNEGDTNPPDSPTGLNVL